jgi:hypothetical protein
MARSYLFNVTAIEDKTILYHLDPRTAEEKRLRYDQSTIWYDDKTDSLMSRAEAVGNS